MQIAGHLFFETEQDYDKEIKPNCIHYAGGIIEKPAEFPAYFEYLEGWDTHSCGKWASCSREEVACAIGEAIGNYVKIIDNLEKWEKIIKGENV